MWLWQNFENRMQLATFHQKLHNSEFEWDETDETDAYLWREGLLNVKEKGMAIYYFMNKCLIMFSSD